VDNVCKNYQELLQSVNSAEFTPISKIKIPQDSQF